MIQLMKFYHQQLILMRENNLSNTLIKRAFKIKTNLCQDKSKMNGCCQNINLVIRIIQGSELPLLLGIG